MTTTMTLNDLLVELGSLSDNKDTAPQRVGARLIESYFDSYNTDNQQDTEAIANLLYFLTDIQVRDYALGLLNVGLSGWQEPALQMLIDKAPTDTIYMDAPACLLAVLQYEQSNLGEAMITLSNANANYSLAQLLHRVFTTGWPASSFTDMRNELHPKVKAGIFGESDDNSK